LTVDDRVAGLQQRRAHLWKQKVELEKKLSELHDRMKAKAAEEEAAEEARRAAKKSQR